MTTFADVYNKTVLPLSTAPNLKDNLKINNTVDINSGSTISAARNVNIKAQSGTEVITESAKEYNIYSGEGGTGNVIVTTGREGNASETANNFVNIDGTINTGTHNSLNMTISGGNLSKNVNPTVTLTEGVDIFDPSSINFSATSTMENPFLADYNKALSDMQAYSPGSAEYISLYNQVHGMEKVMATYGFAEKIGDTEQYIVYDKIETPAMELPNIELAGGNIINNTRGLQNVGEDPMLKYTFGSQKFSDWLQETIVTKKTSWFDGYKKDSDVETLTFKNYEQSGLRLDGRHYFISGTTETKFNVNTPINAGNKKRKILYTFAGVVDFQKDL